MKKLFKALCLFCLSLAFAFGSFFITKKQTQSYLTASADTIGSLPDIPLNPPYNDNPSLEDTIVTYELLPMSTAGNIYYSNSNSSYNLTLFPYIKYSKTREFTKSDGTVVTAGDNTIFEIGFPGFIANFGFNNNGSATNYTVLSRLVLGLNSVFVDNFVTCAYNIDGDTFFPGAIYIDKGFLHGSDIVSTYLTIATNSSEMLSSLKVDAMLEFNSPFTKVVKRSNVKAELHQVITDSNNNRCIIALPCTNNANAISIYLFRNPFYFVDTYNLSDSSIYQLGYNNGLSDNQTNIYNNGYNAGKIVGYNKGKSDGISSTNNYTFTSLIGSIFDVPVQTITGLLNFNVLGINLLDFALSILTIAIVIYIIRLIKGGK